MAYQIPLFSSESGICANLIKDDSLWRWQEKKYTLTFVNGSTIRCFSGEHPQDMRGPEFNLGWIDEVGDLKDGMECWKIISPAVRLKWEQPSRIYCTGTPRTTELMLYLDDRFEHNPDIYEIQTGKTSDNVANLDPSTVDELYAQWEGTRYALQELEGVLLREAENALWTQDTISTCRRRYRDDMEFDVLAIGVDPAVSTDKKADETGIIVGGRLDGKAWILADYSRRASPLEWARLLVQIARKHKCTTIVYERNLAGPLIRDVLVKTLEEMDSSIRLVPVTAMTKKAVRAEPVSALYEAGKVLHMPNPDDTSCSLNKLEAQMTQWSPADAKSPDRIDALVHLVTHLLISGGKFDIMRAGSMPWSRK